MELVLKSDFKRQMAILELKNSVKRFYRAYRLLTLNEQKIEELAYRAVSSNIFLTDAQFESLDFESSGRMKQHIRKIEDIKSGRRYFSLTDTNAEKINTMFTSRFYNFLSCQTFNSALSEDGIVAEDLVREKGATEVKNRDPDDFIEFIIDYNPTIREQFTKRNVFSVLMGEWDNHNSNLLINEDELYHIDLSTICPVKIKGLYPYCPRFGTYQDIFTMDYLFKRRTFEKVIEESMGYINEYYKINNDKLRTFLKEAGIDYAEQIVGSDQLKYMTVGEILTALETYDIEEHLKKHSNDSSDKDLIEKERKKLQIMKDTIVSMLQSYENKETPINAYMDYLDSEEAIVKRFKEDFYTTKKCVIATIQNVLSLNRKDLDFILANDFDIYRVFSEDGSIEKAREIYEKNILDKQKEMFGYAIKYGLLHNVLQVGAENEEYLRRKFGKLFCYMCTDNEDIAEVINDIKELKSILSEEALKTLDGLLDLHHIAIPKALTGEKYDHRVMVLDRRASVDSSTSLDSGFSVE